MKDAKWNRLRQKVIERSYDACSACGAEEKPLSVHHRYYEAGKKKWDYPEESLDALCKKCHGRADELRRQVARATGLLDFTQTTRALGYMEALALLEQEEGSILIRSYEHASGVGDLFDVRDTEIVNNVEEDGRISFARLIALAGLQVRLVRCGGPSWGRR